MATITARGVRFLDNFYRETDDGARGLFQQREPSHSFATYYDEFDRAASMWKLPDFRWGRDGLRWADAPPVHCPETETERIKRLFRPKSAEEWRKRADDLGEAFKNATEALYKSNRMLHEERETSKRLRASVEFNTNQHKSFMAAQEVNRRTILDLQESVRILQTRADQDNDRINQLVDDRTAATMEADRAAAEARMLRELCADLQKQLEAAKAAIPLPVDPFEEIQ